MGRRLSQIHADLSICGNLRASASRSSGQPCEGSRTETSEVFGDSAEWPRMALCNDLTWCQKRLQDFGSLVLLKVMLSY
jgi:hypothetical protein